MKKKLAVIVAALRALDARAEAYWRSERSTWHGYVVIALGLVSGSYAEAWHTLGIADDLIHRIAAALVLLGALLVTPRKSS